MGGEAADSAMTNGGYSGGLGPLGRLGLVCEGLHEESYAI